MLLLYYSVLLYKYNNIIYGFLFVFLFKQQLCLCCLCKIYNTYISARSKDLIIRRVSFIQKLGLSGYYIIIIIKYTQTYI